MCVTESDASRAFGIGAEELSLQLFLSSMTQEIPTLKLLLIGNSNVGKSSLLLRFTDDTFLPQEEVSATIGRILSLFL